jgi:hypothetical protein
MMGFLSGFSNKLLNSDNFNPFSGIPVTTTFLHEYQTSDNSAIQRYAPKFIFAVPQQLSAMLSQRIGHARIRIREQQETSESAIFDNWFGTAQVDGQEPPFTTNCDRLETDSEYHVIYERTKTPTGEAGIRIHDVIS